MEKLSFRIYLRALEPDDCLKTHKWRNDPYYQQGIESVKRYISLDTERRWIANAIKDHECFKNIRFAIVLKENDDMIGLVFLKNVDFVNRKAGYGIFLGESRGKGLASEAHMLILEYAFMDLGLERVAGGVLEDNIPSIKSLEEVGFQREGLLRNAAYKNGTFCNLLEYSLLKDEYIKRYVKNKE